MIAGTATAVSNRVSRRQANRWAAQDQQAYDAQAYEQQQAYQAQPYEQPPAYGGPPPADDMDTKIAQLKELGELKAQGVLSEEEFAAQKRRILGP